MPLPKPDKDELRERKVRAEEWKLFRKTFLFTQKRLADTMKQTVGHISRRTIQQIEAGNITPQADTLRRFAAFKKRHETNGKIRTSFSGTNRESGAPHRTSAAAR